MPAGVGEMPGIFEQTVDSADRLQSSGHDEQDVGLGVDEGFAGDRGERPVQADRGARVFEAEFGNERVGA